MAVEKLPSFSCIPLLQSSNLKLEVFTIFLCNSYITELFFRYLNKISSFFEFRVNLKNVLRFLVFRVTAKYQRFSYFFFFKTQLFQ